MLIDLHTHTKRHSWDSDLTPDELIERSRDAGLHGVCFTEHDFFWDATEVAELGRRHNFLVLAGVEINTENGHILCFGLEGYVYGMHRAHTLAEHVQRHDGVMLAAHPYRRQMPFNPGDEGEYAFKLDLACENPAYAFCRGMERYNGRGKPEENVFSGQVLERCMLPGVAGSDAHAVADIGRCATEFLDEVKDLGDLIRALKVGRMRPVWLGE